jgi:hypothetical protein
MSRTIVTWIDGYSNCGTRIKTAPIKEALAQFQALYPERKYQLTRHNGLWFIEGEGK